MSSPCFSSSRSEIEAVHQDVRADEDLQFSFDSLALPELIEFSWLINLFAWMSPILPFLSTLIEFGFWAGLIFLGAGLAYLIVREVITRLRDSGGELDARGPEQYVPDTDFARKLLDDADELAAEERYAEAIHMLLYRSIDDIQEKSARRIAGNLTSREIGKLSFLPNDARRAFEIIASHVERCFFANQKASADVFDECRKAYSQFSIPAKLT